MSPRVDAAREIYSVEAAKRAATLGDMGSSYSQILGLWRSPSLSGDISSKSNVVEVTKSRKLKHQPLVIWYGQEEYCGFLNGVC